MLAGAVALAGCGGGGGGGDGESADVATVGTTASTPVTTPETVPAPTPPPTSAPTGTTTTPAATTPSKPPSNGEPPNGGGTEPARTELEFRGTKSGVKPRSAGVAPFISVKVTLTSEDGSAHVLKVGSHVARVGGNRTSAFFTLPGLASGKSYRGTVDGKVLVIRATSEPGP